jgi:hyperosmotically inducible protein
MTQFKHNSFSGLAILLFSLLLMFGSAGGAFAAPPDKTQAPARDSADFEAWLTGQVHHRLVMLPYYSVFDNLEYKVDGDKVTLVGEVVQPFLKDEAASAVKHIEGVQSVDNQIKVLPLSRFDNSIRRAEYRAVYSFPGLQMYSLGSVPSIHIIVDNGHVTLEGVVARQADKDAANIVANQVPNVFSVTNNLRVENHS